MLKGIVLASACSLAVAAPVRADSVMQRDSQVATSQNPAFRAEVVEVQTHRSPGATVVGDALGGAVVGGAVGLGVAAYNRYLANGGNGSWDGWQRDVAIGAGIGLAVGLIVGIVDVASDNGSTTTKTYAPVSDRRETGFAPPVAMYGSKF